MFHFDLNLKNFLHSKHHMNHSTRCKKSCGLPAEAARRSAKGENPLLVVLGSTWSGYPLIRLCEDRTAGFSEHGFHPDPAAFVHLSIAGISF
jgi:hypothetical protein